MNHHHLVLGVVGADIVGLKPLGQVQIDLDGRSLPLATERIGQFDINFGRIEDSPALINLVGEAPLLQGRSQRRRRRSI